jgi:hypothetical protein
MKWAMRDGKRLRCKNESFLIYESSDLRWNGEPLSKRQSPSAIAAWKSHSGIRSFLAEEGRKLLKKAPE